MKFYYQLKSERLVLFIEGGFVSQSISQHWSDLNGVLDKDIDSMVIDMQRVTFIDSCGVGLLILWLKRLRAQGKSLSLIGLAGQPLKMVRLLRLERSLAGLEGPALNETREGLH